MENNSTFNLPNMYLRSPMYSGLGSMGAISDGSSPNITGFAGWVKDADPNGAFYTQDGLAGGHTSSGSNQFRKSYFNASRSSACYGRYTDNKIIPSFIHMPWYIKY